MAAGATRELSGRTGRMVYAPVVPDELAAGWLEEYGAWFEDDAQLAVVERKTPLGRVVAKRELPRGWKGSLVRVHARPFRSPAAFHLGRELLSTGLLTPEPLACVTSRTGEPPRACLIARHAAGLDPWGFVQNEPPSGEPTALRELVAALAAALARLHAAGFRHRDLKGPNIIVRRSEEGSIEVLWTDLESLERPRIVTDGVRVRDLARLGMSFDSARARRAGVRADAWPTFVQAYLERARRRTPVAEELARFLVRTQRWASARIERNVVRGRPVA